MPGLRSAFVVTALAAAVLATGCADEGGGDTDIDNPDVVATSPEDGAVDVNLNPLIEIWFDQEMDEATIDSASCHVAGAVTERLEYDDTGRLIRLYLRELLDPETGYVIFVDSTITNKTGDPMTEDRYVAFNTGAMDCEHIEDYLEPNDTIGEAIDIALVKAYPLLSSCGEGSPEYYRFVLNDTALVTARIEHVYSDDPKPMWYVGYKRATDEAYTTYTGWFAEGADLNHRFTFLPGTYYLHTGSAEPEDRIVVYNLILQLSAPCPDDSLEDNDFIDEATPIGPGLTDALRGCFRDRDCYSIHLGAGQTLSATVEQYPDIGAQLDLEILGPAGEVLTGDAFEVNPAVITWTATQDTSHYIAATYWSNNVRYSIEVEVLILP
jgi:hypothetical protein